MDNLKEYVDIQNYLQKEQTQSVNNSLSLINYKDNDIKKNQELLQLKANEYNKYKLKEYNLDNTINVGTNIIRQKNKKNSVKSFLIELMKRIIFVLLLIAIPIGLYWTGFISSKSSLIIAGVVIFVSIMVLIIIPNKKFTKLKDNTSPLYRAKKVNKFKFPGGDSSLLDDKNESSLGFNQEEELGSLNQEEINSKLIDKCCNSSDENSSEYIDMEVRNRCSFYSDKSLPYQIYI